jgi:acyl-CoA hydrolase
MKNIETFTTMVIMPADLNAHGKLFGGQLLKWMDEQAYICATKNFDKHIVTVSIENAKFLLPAKNGDLLEIHSEITKIKGAIIEIQINSFITKNKDIQKIAEAKFYMTAVNDSGKPVRL